MSYKIGKRSLYKYPLYFLCCLELWDIYFPFILDNRGYKLKMVHKTRPTHEESKSVRAKIGIYHFR